MHPASPTANRWLPAILLLGAALRFFPIWFGLPYQYSRPDETEAVGHALGILGGDLNPHFFHWPSLTFYLFAAAFAVVSGVQKLFLGDPVLTRDVAVLTGRIIVAAAGTLTIVPVYRLARRAFGQRTGLAAAFFLAVAVLHVRDSHFAMTDVLMTSLVMLCLAQLAAATDTQAAAPPVSRATLGGFAVAGLLGGLATSTKYNAAAVVVAMAAAQVILLLRFRKPLSPAAWAPSVVFVVAAAAGFVAGTPYSILDAPAFVADLRYDFTHLSAAHGIDVGPGWYAHLTRSLPYGCGLLIFVAAIPGMVIAVRQSPRHGVVLVAFVAAFLAVLGSGRTVFFRYVMPLVPVVCVFAGVAAARTRRGDGARRAGQRGHGNAPVRARHRRAVAGEQRLDGRPPCAHRYADPGRAMARRAAASGAFRLRRGRNLRAARPARRELSRLDLRSADAVVRRSRRADAALARDPGVAAAPLRAA